MCCCVCDCCCCDFILVIIAFFIPPLPVALKRGLCSCDFIINICLCLLGYVPGLIHSWYIILKNPDPKNYYDEERQIFIAIPPNQHSNNNSSSSSNSTPEIFINQQPDQTRIRFNHPEPFLESQNHLYKNKDSNGQVSPLSNSPLLNNSHLISKPHVSSPLSKPINENNSNDFVDDEEEPPSYENVMNETSKQFK